MKEKFRRFVEGIVTAVIILVLVQTLLEDVLVLSEASWTVRRIFIFTGFTFDLFFTGEFLIRGWSALVHRSLGRYLLRKNGWVDLVASIPLLVFTSGPELIALLSGGTFAGAGAMVGLLKVVKAVRMARVLRLLRLLKIFRRIRFADSAMVQRHTVRIVTTAAAALILSTTVIGAVFALTRSVGSEEVWSLEQEASVRSLADNPEWAAGPDAAGDWGRSHPSVMLVKDDDRTLYARDDEVSLRRNFGPGDYTVGAAGPYMVWFDLRPAAVSQSRLNLTVFLSTLAVVILIMVTYSPHFAITVSDPVNVMARGLREKSYNFEVSVPRDYSEDDIFRLADAYNDEYLPLKERNATEEQSGSGALDICLDDISDLLTP